MICTGFFNDRKKENFLTVNSKEVVTGPLSGANIIFETYSAKLEHCFCISTCELSTGPTPLEKNEKNKFDTVHI